MSGFFTTLYYSVWYGVNYQYISTQLCVNRDKKDLHCNGACQISMKLRESEKEFEQNKSLVNNCFWPLGIVETHSMELCRNGEIFRFPELKSGIITRCLLFNAPPG